MQQEINVAALFGAYRECKVSINSEDELQKIDAIYKFGIDSFGENDEHGLEHHNYSACKLSLKPLSAITDEHLEMIARMALAPYSTEIGDVLKIERELFADGKTECSVWFKKLKIYFCLNVEYVAFMFVKDGCEVEGVDNQVAIIDTLRLLGYDCGYMHIPSLIEDGRYAIDITKLQAP